MCRLSIIIPLWADNDSFEDTLASVLQNRPAECEVLVVHSQAYDDPYDLKGEVRFVPVPRRRSSQVINAGCRAAQGDIVHVLQPGVLATDGWTAAALASFHDPQVSRWPRCWWMKSTMTASWLPDCAIRGVAADCATARVSTRSEISRVLRRAVIGPGLFAGFYRRWTWEAIGGFCERLDVNWADVNFALSLRSLGYQAVLEPDSVMRASPTAVLDAPLSFRAGRGAERVFWRHAAANGWLASLVCHPFTVFGSLLKHANRGRAYAHLLGRLERPAWPRQPCLARGQDSPCRRVFSARNTACRAE